MVMKPVTFSWVALNLKLFGRKFLIQKFVTKLVEPIVGKNIQLKLFLVAKPPVLNRTKSAYR